MSVGLVVDTFNLGLTEQKLRRLADINIRDLLEVVGSEVEGQTRARIEDEKRSPDGAPWAPWSTDYAKTRHGGHSLLMDEGHLGDAIQYIVSGDEVAVGSNLVYHATHQYGRGPIPARPQLGLSAANERDIQELVGDFIEDLMR